MTSLGLFFGIPAAAQTPSSPQKLPRPGTISEDVINPDRPGIADGSTVIGQGRLQIETGFQQEFREDAGIVEHRYFFPSLLRLGITPHLEARVESNTFTLINVSRENGLFTQANSGLSPISIGVKFQIQESDGLRKPSLGAIFRLFPASGTDTLHTTHATADFRLAADWDLTSRLSLNPNVGFGLYESDLSKVFRTSLFAVTLNAFNEAKTLNPFVDVGVQTPEAPALRASVIVDAGIAYQTSRNVQVDVSAGAGARGHTPPHPFYSVGISLRFRASQPSAPSRRMVDPLALKSGDGKPHSRAS